MNVKETLLEASNITKRLKKNEHLKINSRIVINGKKEEKSPFTQCYCPEKEETC